jgi:hypothetical protein
VAMVGATGGPVIVYDHPWYETLAGKGSWAQGEAVNDVLRAGPSVARNELLRSISDTLSSGQVTEVIVDDTGDTNILGSALRTHYVVGPPALPCANCFFPVTDLALRPRLTYFDRGPAPTG